MTTRVSLNLPPSALEGARAAQAMNRQRLAGREEETRLKRQAGDAIKRLRADPDTPQSRNAGAKDPWRGAVPEPEPSPFTPVQLRGTRFHPVGAWWQWDSANGELRVETADRSARASILVPSGWPVGDSDSENGVLWYQAFPAGRNRMVLLFYMQKLTYQRAETGSIGEPFQVPGAPAAMLESAAAFVSQYNAAADAGSGDPYYRLRISEVLAPPYSVLVADTRVTTYDQLSFAVDLRCFVVTRSAVSAIDCPENLRDIIQQKYKYMSAVTKDTLTLPVNTGTGYVFIAYFFTNQVGQPEIGIHTSFSDFASSGSKQTESLSYQLANSNLYQSDLNTWLVLLRSYGYGKLLNRAYSQDPAWGWTPAIFAFLKNYQGEFHGATNRPEAYSYDYVADNYFPEDSPKFMLEAGYPADSVTPNYYYFNPPLSGGNVTSPSAFTSELLKPRKISGPLGLVPVESTLNQDYQVSSFAGYPWRNGLEVPIVTWDWNRPLACILELLDLGFSAQDLMLSDGEVDALATTDTALARFKF